MCDDGAGVAGTGTNLLQRLLSVACEGLAVLGVPAAAIRSERGGT